MSSYLNSSPVSASYLCVHTCVCACEVCACVWGVYVRVCVCLCTRFEHKSTISHSWQHMNTTYWWVTWGASISNTCSLSHRNWTSLSISRRASLFTNWVIMKQHDLMYIPMDTKTNRHGQLLYTNTRAMTLLSAYCAHAHTRKCDPFGGSKVNV